MAGMMRWSCSRGCCTRGDRACEKRTAAAEITSEMIDAEIERWRPGLELMAKWPEEDL